MMLRSFIVSCAALAASAGAVLAAEEPSKPSSCAFVRSIDKWEAIDAQSAFIYTSPKRKFKVTFVAPCRELKWAIFARIDTRPSSATCLSAGDTLVFGRGALVPDGRWQNEERCMIKTIEAVPRDGEKPAEAPPANP